jgi:hypothetical protein
VIVCLSVRNTRACVDSNGEDDWEKEFDVDAAVETNVPATTTSTAQPAISTGANAEVCLNCLR